MTADPGAGDPISQIIAGLLSGQGGAPSSSGGATNGNALGGNFLDGGKGSAVYWGQKPILDRSGEAIVAGKSGGDYVRTVQDSVADWYSWSDDERNAFAQQVYRLGFIKNPNDYQGAFSVWGNAVQEASNFYSAANKKITPWQALDIMGTVGGGAGGRKANQTLTTVSKNTSYITPQAAEGVVKTIFQNAVGRDPTQDELSRYRGYVAGYEKANPQVSTTEHSFDGQGNETSSNTTSTGDTGAGLQQALTDKAQADPEYGAYQAATTYYNALMQMVGTPNGG